MVGSKRQAKEHIEARKMEFAIHLGAVDMRLSEKIKWLKQGSKRGKHQPILTVRRYDKLTHLMGAANEQPRADPDRPKKTMKGPSCPHSYDKKWVARMLPRTKKF